MEKDFEIDRHSRYHAARAWGLRHLLSPLYEQGGPYRGRLSGIGESSKEPASGHGGARRANDHHAGGKVAACV